MYTYKEISDPVLVYPVVYSFGLAVWMCVPVI